MQAEVEKTRFITITQIIKKPIYANIAIGEPKQAIKKADKSWIIIQKKKAILAAELASKKTIEFSQRRIIFQRQKKRRLRRKSI
jgi:hypothetical protein